MLKVIESPISNWTRTEDNKLMTNSGYQIGEDVLSRMCKWNRVPTALIDVDQKHKTGLTEQVLGLTFGTKIPELVVDDQTNKVISYVAPKYQWVPDEVFIDMDFNKWLLDSGHEVQEEEKVHGAARQKTYTFLSKDNDPNYNFMGDVFKKQLIIERAEEGGINITFGLLRLVCTNGMVVNEKMFRKQFKQVTLGNEALRTFIPQFAQQLADMSLSQYLHDLWTDRNGNMIKASVQDYLGMKNTLKAITDEDNADLMFPVEPIKSHYMSQGIDIDRLTFSQRDTIPAGVSYYDSINFLTHGVKAKEGGELTLEEKLKVSNWSRPSRVNKLKNSAISYKGQPYFSPEQIHRQAGDRF